MTDVEDLLTRDGAAWRAAQPPPPDAVDPAVLVRPPRRWQPAAAAAAVVLLAAGAGVGLARDADRPTAGSSPGPLVRDGDRVTGEGWVLAEPGRPVRLCAVPGVVIVGEAPDCTTGLPVTGLDRGRLPVLRQAGRPTVATTVRVTGVYRHGSLAVDRQEAPAPVRTDAPPGPDRASCPAPPGGWVPVTGDIDPVLAITRRHPDRYAVPIVRHLDGPAGPATVAVLEVGTGGDVAAARRELTRVFPAASLCVTRSVWTAAGKAAAYRTLGSAPAEALGVSAAGERVDDVVEASVVVLDEATRRFLAGVGDVVPVPMLTKVP